MSMKKKKKFVIVGAGTAGAISAVMIKKYWGNKVDVSVYYDKSKEIIGVGESTAPGIIDLFEKIGLTPEDIIKELPLVTLKLGINSKDWIPNSSYFHGLLEVSMNDDRDSGFLNCGSLHTILNDSYDGGINFNNATNTVPSERLEGWDEIGLHIDTKEFSDYVFKKMEEEITLVDDVVERVRVNPECTEIVNIECKNSGIIDADYFIDASGFESVLFRHLNPKWNDIKKDLPLDKALSQEVENKSNEIPSYTLTEATDNGWVWVIPVGDKFRTGYLYSSKFISDEEAKEKYNDWLLKNYNTELENDNIIEFRSGYYEDNYIGNCLAVGLYSGFVEPLEALAFQMIINQLESFTNHNSTFKNLDFNRRKINEQNRRSYISCIKFVALHYATNRTDSDFWRYMTNNKMQWVKEFEELCREEFLDLSGEDELLDLWVMDSYIQVVNGLQMFNKKAIKKFINSKSKEIKKEILDDSKTHYKEVLSAKKNIEYVSHKDLLEEIRNSTKEGT